MGWKTFKEKFKISDIVYIDGPKIVIETKDHYCPIRIIMETGEIQEQDGFTGFTQKSYPELCKASPKDIVKVIKKTDRFKESATVYTFGENQIHRKKCESLDYPVTHDGEYLPHGRYFKNRSEAVKAAGISKLSKVKRLAHVKREISEIQKDIKFLQERLGYLVENRDALNR